jgi:hypothetical protein
MSELAGHEKLRGLGGHEVAIDDSSKRRSGNAEGSGAVENIVESLPRKLTKALQAAGGRVASSLLDKSVIVSLPRRSITEQGNRATRLKDGSAEKIIVLAIVSHELHAQRSGTGGLSPDGDLVGATTEGSDVVVKPLQGHALILESEVTSALLLHLLAEKETPLGDSVVDGGSNDRLALLDGLINDPAEVVSGVS